MKNLVCASHSRHRLKIKNKEPKKKNPHKKKPNNNKNKTDNKQPKKPQPNKKMSIDTKSVFYVSIDTTNGIAN